MFSICHLTLSVPWRVLNITKPNLVCTSFKTLPFNASNWIFDRSKFKVTPKSRVRFRFFAPVPIPLYQLPPNLVKCIYGVLPFNAWPQGQSHTKVKGHFSFFTTLFGRLNRLSPNLELCRAWQYFQWPWLHPYMTLLSRSPAGQRSYHLFWQQSLYHSTDVYQICCDTSVDHGNSCCDLKFKVTPKVKGHSNPMFCLLYPYLFP